MKCHSRLQQYFKEVAEKSEKERTLQWKVSSFVHSAKIRCIEPLSDDSYCIADESKKVSIISSDAVRSNSENKHNVCTELCVLEDSLATTSLAISSGCGLVASCSNEPVVRVIQLSNKTDEGGSTPPRIQKYKFKENVRCAHFCSDDRNGSTALIAGGTLAISLMDCQTKQVFQEIRASNSKSNPIVSLMPVGDGCLLLTGFLDKSLKVWDLRVKSHPIRVIEPLLNALGPVSSTTHLDSCGRILARADSIGQIYFEDFLSGKKISKIKFSDSSKVQSIRFANETATQGLYLSAATEHIQYLCCINSSKILTPELQKVENTKRVRWNRNNADEFVSLSEDRCMNVYRLISSEVENGHNNVEN
ncbi:WD repeat-containing protein 47 [Ditylenchus destructor]|uniref:WD repeat-containing protein 47 n=1 Tax=Ditylenchus destructor TaxID=166010 RepID=A0AAD4MUL1_9BILA|nr:WD repeat-containing protein 47 [Ditylenchus destructor]